VVVGSRRGWSQAAGGVGPAALPSCAPILPSRLSRRSSCRSSCQRQGIRGQRHKGDEADARPSCRSSCQRQGTRSATQRRRGRCPSVLPLILPATRDEVSDTKETREMPVRPAPHPASDKGRGQRHKGDEGDARPSCRSSCRPLVWRFIRPEVHTRSETKETRETPVSPSVRGQSGQRRRER
jgi:hypothetical protein